MNTQRKVILYIAMSLDGYIATENDDLSFLNIVEDGDQDYGYAQFTSSIDTVIMGRKTYDKVLTLVPEFPHADKESYIITRSNTPPIGNTTFYSGDLKELIQSLKNKTGKHIYCDGGAELANTLLSQGLIDEIIVSIIPILLGSGIPLFKKQAQNTSLTLISSKSYKKGLVQLHYRIER